MCVTGGGTTVVVCGGTVTVVVTGGCVTVVVVTGGVVWVVVGGVLYSFSVRWLLRRLSEPGFALGGALILLTFYLGMPLLPAWYAAAPLCLLGGFGFYMLHNTLQTRATEMYIQTMAPGIPMTSATSTYTSPS